MEGGRISSTFESLINPQVEVPDTITRLTGITSKEVGTAPPPTTVFPKVVDKIKDAVLVAHNASFDRKFLEYELLTVLKAKRTFDFICTTRIGRSNLAAARFTCMTVNHDIWQDCRVEPTVRSSQMERPHKLLEALEPITADVHALNHFSLNTEAVLFWQVAETISVDQVDCNSTVTGGLL